MLNKVTPLDAPSTQPPAKSGPRPAPSPASPHVTGPHPPFDPAEPQPVQTDPESASENTPNETIRNDPNAKS